MLRTVNPPIPKSSLGCDLPRILSSDPLAEPPDPQGDHDKAANREGGNPDDEDGHRAQNCGDDPGLVVTLDNGGRLWVSLGMTAFECFMAGNLTTMAEQRGAPAGGPGQDYEGQSVVSNPVAADRSIAVANRN